MKFFRLVINSLLSVLAKKTVGARILLIDKDKILLVKHTYQPGWYTIGGAVERGESPHEAICRELKEEVGVTLHQPPKLFSVYHSNLEKRDDYVVLFVGEQFSQEDCTSDEIFEKRWFHINQLPEEVTPATKRRINEYLGKASISDRW